MHPNLIVNRNVRKSDFEDLQHEVPDRISRNRVHKVAAEEIRELLG